LEHRAAGKHPADTGKQRCPSRGLVIGNGGAWVLPPPCKRATGAVALRVGACLSFWQQAVGLNQSFYLSEHGGGNPKGNEGACRAHSVRCTRSPRDAGKNQREWGSERGIRRRNGIRLAAQARDDGRITIQPGRVLPQSANGVKSGWRTVGRNAEDRGWKIEDGGGTTNGPNAERTADRRLPP
jgi:hypothetical protein